MQQIALGVHGVLQGVGVAVGVDVVLEAVDEELIVVVEGVTDELDNVVEIDMDELDDGANWRRNAESILMEDWISDTLQWM